MRNTTSKPESALATADRVRLLAALAAGVILISGAMPRGPARADRFSGFVCGAALTPACSAVMVMVDEAPSAIMMRVFVLPGLVVIVLAAATVTPLLMARLICARRGGRYGP